MPWLDNEEWDGALESGPEVVLSGGDRVESSCSGRAS